MNMGTSLETRIKVLHLVKVLIGRVLMDLRNNVLHLALFKAISDV